VTGVQTCALPIYDAGIRGLDAVFRRHDAEPAYSSIVGAGANACILHYRANKAVAKDGDLVLIDAGAEIGRASGKERG